MNDQTDTAKANGQSDAAKADRELKQKHRAMWASGDYPALADEMLLELGAILVEACGITSRNSVLDVAAGSGNAAIPAAEVLASGSKNDVAAFAGNLEGNSRCMIGLPHGFAGHCC